MPDPSPAPCVSRGCKTIVDHDVTQLCRSCRDEAEVQLLDDGRMSPDDYAHEHGYITDDMEEVEAFDA